jgi:hypothetical protein
VALAISEGVGDLEKVVLPDSSVLTSTKVLVEFLVRVEARARILAGALEGVLLAAALLRASWV